MRSQSVWVNYIMYFAFAITTLSIVLYTVLSYLESQRAKYYLNYCENLISFLKDKVNYLKTIYKGNITISLEIPENAILNISNKMISCTVYINKNVPIVYSSVYSFNNCTDVKGNLKFCTIYSDIDIKNNLTLRYGKYNLILVKNESGIFIYK